jgi:flagellar motor protein MotB
MRLILLACVVALTGLTFFSATRTLPLTTDPDLVDVLKADADTLSAEVEDARLALAESDQSLATAEAENLELVTEIDAQADQIAELTAQENDTIAAQAAIDALERENTEMGQQVADLETRLAQSDTDLVAAKEEVAQLLEAESAPVEATVIEEFENQILALTTQNAELDEALMKRDDIIDGFMTSTGSSSMGSVMTCQDRSDALVAETQVSFDTGTKFTNETVLLLEQIAMVAIDCAQDDLKLEIEGHADSSYDFSSNLLLSDARAKAVLDFLTERGVPAQAMRSVGVGDREPIADNGTNAGRSQNQRIIFEWEQG